MKILANRWDIKYGWKGLNIYETFDIFLIYQFLMNFSKIPREHGSILYCTTGIVLQKMQTDALMRNVNYIILDEIHERSVETDLLMALIKKVCCGIGTEF